ncbi:cytochrome P450 4C1-like isoform X2 [Daktulosphaira vitifoliae]|nr:cytochrome P450 4C1-like isoform X2 [Daktulosphaira vitifoliae]XP_050520151.1 cytochrome P450 4C1-like isoform X2 [Daktulosphaira vitifoliae]
MCVVPTTPEDIKTLLLHPKVQKKGLFYKTMRETFLGEGLTTNNNLAKWHKHRKIVSSSLNNNKMKSFIQIFYEEANILSNMILDISNKESNECEISVPISLTTMKIIKKSVFGNDISMKNEKYDFTVVKCIQTLMMIVEYRIRNLWYLNKSLFKWSAMGKIEERCKKEFLTYIDCLMGMQDKELNKFESYTKSNLKDSSKNGHKIQSIMDSIVENSSGMTYKNIRDETSTLIGAGQDTTAFTNTCVIFHLAYHQDIQHKVFEEQEVIFSTGDYNRQPTYDDLNKMKYLERVIKETLRINPPVQLITRDIEEEIDMGNYILPADSQLFVYIGYLHRSSLYYKDPKSFNPDNFLPETCKNRHPYAFLPFSGGPRNCIGNKFAMLQMKTIISTLIRKNIFFPSQRYSSPTELQFKYSITTKFANDCFVKIKSRQLM